jgi:hypothetical protein
MINRRNLLAAAASATAVSTVIISDASAQVAPHHEALGLLSPNDDPEFGALVRGSKSSGGSAVGTGPSRHEEVRNGFRLLLDAPRNASVMETARFFQGISLKNSDGELYNAEWSTRANPLIVGFFAMTGTAPSQGDQTSWCAAFVSTCLFLADKPNKYTALSGGYRSFGSVATSPREGDIVVFRKPGEEGTKGFGHVGFFLREEKRNGADGLWLLGGNQRGNSGTTGAVTEAWFPASSPDLIIHSIRKIPGT